MFHFWRKVHKLVGVCACVFLMAISATGFLLALKREISWMRPSEKEAQRVEHHSELVSLATVADAAFAVGLPVLASMSDVDRIDYRPKQNVFKVVSKKGYKEVQVDGKTGKVLNVADRNDTFIEAIHDLSWFHDGVRTYWLPVVAVALFALSSSGLYMYVNPILRRRAYFRQQKGKQKA